MLSVVKCNQFVMHKHDIGNECVKNNKLGRVLRSLCEYIEYIGQDILKNVLLLQNWVCRYLLVGLGFFLLH